MKNVIMLLAPGFEEIEAVTPLDILRRGEVRVDLVSITDYQEVEGSHRIRLFAEMLLCECQAEDYDMVVLPGGPGVEKLKRDPQVLDLVRDFHRKNKWIAAICAAPLVLKEAGILSGKKLTSYPSVKDELLSSIGTYTENNVEIDGKLITARGAGCAEAFGLALLEKLTGPAAAADVKAKIISSL